MNRFRIYLLCASWCAVGLLLATAVHFGAPWLAVVAACQSIIAANYTGTVLEDAS